MLHITNGDCAAGRIAATGVEGEIIPWRDVLHEGPVHADLHLADLSDTRARFIAESGWGAVEDVVADFEARDRALERFRDHDEVVLWFEHDLYDQLQLLQLLEWLGARDPGATRITLVCEAEYLGPMPVDRARELFAARRAVTGAQFELARAAWHAFCSADPTPIEALVAGDTSDLPFVAGALRRHLEQFPSVENGLSRSERQALGAIAGGCRTIREAFRAAHHAVEDPIFLGDSVFAWYLEGLAAGRAPLVRFGSERASGLDREVALTETGEAVHGGREDRVRANGIDRWLGGVHLAGDEAEWRWDAGAGRLRRRM
jgi:hypothetical protein